MGTSVATKRMLLALAFALAACGVIDGLTAPAARPPDDDGGADAGVVTGGGADAGSGGFGHPDGGSDVGGASWHGAVRLDPGVQADHPSLAVRADGRVYAAWDVNSSHAIALATRAPGASAWDAPKELPTISDAWAAAYPQVAVGGAGKALVLYVAYAGGSPQWSTVRAARFGDDLTVPLAEIVRLDGSTGHPATPSIGHSLAVDEDGRAVAVWRDEGGTVASASDAGSAWSSPLTFDTSASAPSTGPLLGVGASGGKALFAWRTASLAGAQLATISGGLSLSGQAHALADFPSTAAPRVALRGDTGLVVWPSSGDGSSGTTLSYDLSRSGWRGAAPVPGAVRVGDYEVAANEAGHAVLLWQQFPAVSSGAWAADLYGALFDGSRWSSPQRINRPGPSGAAASVAVDMNERGDAVAAWSDLDEGGSYTRIWASFLHAGVGAWSSPVAIDGDSSHASDAKSPRFDRSVRVALSADGAGATVVWRQSEPDGTPHVWANWIE